MTLRLNCSSSRVSPKVACGNTTWMLFAWRGRVPSLWPWIPAARWKRLSLATMAPPKRCGARPWPSLCSPSRKSSSATSPCSTFPRVSPRSSLPAGKLVRGDTLGKVEHGDVALLLFRDGEQREGHGLAPHLFGGAIVASESLFHRAAGIQGHNDGTLPLQAKSIQVVLPQATFGE